jgi:hypothetical protein
LDTPATKGLTDEEDTNEDLMKASEAHCLHVIGISAKAGGVNGGGYVRAQDPVNDERCRYLSVRLSVCGCGWVWAGVVSVCVAVCLCAWTYIHTHTESGVLNAYRGWLLKVAHFEMDNKMRDRDRNSNGQASPRHYGNPLLVRVTAEETVAVSAYTCIWIYIYIHMHVSI